MSWDMFSVISTFVSIMIPTMFFETKIGIFKFFIRSLRIIRQSPCIYNIHI